MKILKASTTREKNYLVIQGVDGVVSSSEQILHTNDSSAVNGAFRKWVQTANKSFTIIHEIHTITVHRFNFKHIFTFESAFPVITYTETI